MIKQSLRGLCISLLSFKVFVSEFAFFNFSLVQVYYFFPHFFCLFYFPLINTRIPLAESSIIPKLSERYTKMLETYCIDRLNN